MAVATLSPTAAQVRSVKPTYNYGATTVLRVQTSASAAFVRVGMPSDIPSNATIISAILTFTQVGAMTGTNLVSVQRNASAWTMSKLAWTGKPGQSGVRVDLSKTASVDGTLWSYDVTPDVQAFVVGSVVNNGWYLNTTSATERQFRGSANTIGQPQLVITYLTPTDAPLQIAPVGNQAVSVAKPWLTFQVPPDTTAVNVQIDADMLSTYDFDSGDVATSSGALDTSTTAWAGLTAGGATLYWRVRTKSALGYSPYSAWAAMRRVAQPVVTITSPTATSDDTTPPVVWSVAGTQTAWQVVITNALGKVLADSGVIQGTATTWTPPKAVTVEGSTATVEVRVWDGTDRVATPGDPLYARATLTFTGAGTAAVGPALTCTATSDGFTPAVTITATRGAAPDSWTVLRNDGKGEVRIASGLAPASANLMYQDWTADPNKAHTYRAAPYTNGTGTASGGPTATVTPRCTGIWLVDPANPTVYQAVIWGDDSGSFDATELAVIHQPIAGPPIRRVAYRPPLSGAVTGELMDVGTSLADAQIADLYDFKANDRDLQLVLGDRNITVRVGDLAVYPVPDSDLDRHSVVTFNWWEQGTPPWSP
jgi:hypothetical protein